MGRSLGTLTTTRAWDKLDPTPSPPPVTVSELVGQFDVALGQLVVLTLQLLKLSNQLIVLVRRRVLDPLLILARLALLLLVVVNSGTEIISVL